MDRNHFMIHLCTFTTLMLLQNNISQKILFIATRTIQFPGSVFKVCIDLIVAIVTSSIYFDVQKFPYLFENIYISNQYCLFFHYHDDDDDSMIMMIMMIMMMIEQCNQDGNVGKPDNARDPPSNPSRTS